MKFTLTQYQEEAVRAVLDNLRKARKRWHEDTEKHAFSLTAATGAGKTVMAGAVFEALFYGNDAYEFEADPGAVIIWFSDDPSLNEQTRFRLMECSDRLLHSNLVVVENTFNRAQFDAKKIYFLNTQKLGKNGLLVRGFGNKDEQGGDFPEMRPDLHSFTIWDTICNTIQNPERTLYLVLDEAHRGMGNPSAAALNEKSTLVKQLINGEQGVPGIPVVLGISATADRFNKAMKDAKGRTTFANVEVDPKLVRESGLLKDIILLDIPDETGKFDTVLVRRATQKLRESHQEWAAYAKQQESIKPVLPLMVLQVPNTPNPTELGRALDSIFQEWPELPESSVAHVLGEHINLTFGRHVVPHISPERVQESSSVRVLIAKEAISTGWDCPRAEVLVSFRASVDHTHITQLLGRMVRAPLARRIPGNDRLNSVDCLLPFFNKKTAYAVVDALMQGGGDVPPVGRILVNPREMKPNSAVSQAVWEKLTSLPTQTRPQRGAKPPIRLTALAHELVSDGFLADAGTKAHTAMHKMLDAFLAERREEFDNKRACVLTVEGRTVVANLLKESTATQSFQLEADATVINDAFRRTARILSPDIARSYTKFVAAQKPGAGDDMEGALIEAREDLATLGLMENLQGLFDLAAKQLSDDWFSEYREQIKHLPDGRREVYRQISALSREPEDLDLAKPASRWEPTEEHKPDGTQTQLPVYEHHLLCDERGFFPAKLNDWESEVLEVEMNRERFRFWYRNPSYPSQDSLAVAYEDGTEARLARPDFLFFSESQDGEITADIVDPHGTQLADSLPKLKGLARSAEKHGATFRRLEGVAGAQGAVRKLNLKNPEVRKAIHAAQNAKELFDGVLANDYV